MENNKNNLFYVTKKKNTFNNLPKCECVPSGRCHSHTLAGCPHKHYFNKNGVWTCIIKK